MNFLLSLRVELNHFHLMSKRIQNTSMKLINAIIFCFVTSSIYPQSEVNIYTEREGAKVYIYADNPSLIPMTADLSLDLINMKTDFGGSKSKFIVPPKSKKHRLVSAQAIRRNGRTGLSLESVIYVGDVTKAPENDFLYELPFESGESYTVTQGYNGRFSHQGENALDFGLDIGDKVFAARGGIVYKVIEKNSKSCNHSSCQEFNNMITIYHSDGTFSEYSHLKYNGSRVKEGQKVAIGDFIGYSGNTGWSSGPHLHFVVYKYDENGQRVTLKTKFRTSKREGVFLKENEGYTKG